MNPKATNRNQQQTSEQKIVEGLKKHEAVLTSLVIDGTAYKTADVITHVQSLVNSGHEVVSSRATWQANIVSDRAEREKMRTFLSGLRKALHVAFGNSIDVLADFGLAPNKPRKERTPEQKTASAAKAKATRIARHTMGSKQKARIKGDGGTSLPQGGVTRPTAATGPGTSTSTSTTAPAAAQVPASPSAAGQAPTPVITTPHS